MADLRVGGETAPPMARNTLEFLPRAAQRVVPWKNGGGRTREVALGSRSDGPGFRWRVSVAEVASDGPFSFFPGIDRTLWLLRGRGMSLEIDGASHRLDEPLASVAFPGEATVSAHLIDGPTEDLNVMVERSSTRAETRIVRVESNGELSAPASPCEVVLLVLEGELAVGDGRREVLRLAAGDAMLACGVGRGFSLHAERGTALALSAVFSPG